MELIIQAESLCDQLITKDGKIVSVLVKEVNPNIVKYKMCRDYGTKSVSGLILIEKSKIQKIIFADGRIIEYNSPKKENTYKLFFCWNGLQSFFTRCFFLIIT